MHLIKHIIVWSFFLAISLSSNCFATRVNVDTKERQSHITPANVAKHSGTAQRNETFVRSTENQVQDGEMHIADSARIVLGQEGLKIESSNGKFKLRLGGRLHADASFSRHEDFLDANGNRIETNNGTEMRRGRIGFEGTVFSDWNYKGQLEFAGDEVELKDLWTRYTGLALANITLGEQKQAFSRELQESSNDMLFIERSAMNVINGAIVDRAVGLNLSSHGQSWAGQVGIYGDSIATKKRQIGADKGWAISSRVTFTPLHEKNRLIHLGVAGNFREPNEVDTALAPSLSLASKSTNMSNLSLISTLIENIDNIKMLGLEASGILGPFSIGAEYTNSWINRKNDESDLKFNGWYGEAAWTLTGESRHYRRGNFFRVIPTNSFSFLNGGTGAWELAVRYAEADLNDGHFKGGKLTNLTIALNWYLNHNIRLMAGYDRALKITDSSLTKLDGNNPKNLNTFMFRAQVAF